MMNPHENHPLEEIAANLQKQVDAAMGIKGALFGAGLGAVRVALAMKATGHKPTVAELLTGAVVGIAYGAADTKAIRGE